LRIATRTGSIPARCAPNTLRRVAALVLVLLALGACTRTGDGSKTAGGRNPWTHPDRLVIAAASDPRNLDPALASGQPTGEISMFLFSYTVRYDDKARPVPDALRELPTVENGDVSRDGLTLKYRLRPNMKWHDGAPVTCADLAFTWRVVMNPHNNIVTTDGYKDIASIDCRDPLVAVVHMKRLYAPFLQQLWSVNGNAPILPEHILAKYNDDKGSFNTAPYQNAPIGSGPYAFVAWDRGSMVRMKAFDGYFLGKPKIAEVDYRIVPDENTLATLIGTHEIDVLFHGMGTTWDRIKAVPGTVAITPSIFSYTHIDFNLHRPIFADRRVREALEYALDRPAILAHTQHGLGDLAETDQSPAIGRAYDPTVKKHPYDPAAARRELDAAGWHAGAGGVRYNNGVPLAFTISTQSEANLNIQVETLAQAYWKSVGARVTIKNAPTSVFFDNSTAGILQGGKYDAAIFTWAASADPDDSAIYSGDNFVPRGQNNLFWNDPAATKAMNDALATVDMKRRVADYHIVQQRMAIDVPTIILWFRHEPEVYNSDLKHFSATPVLTTPFWNTWQYEL
jgi:peptide/nickel transport system substrate-binding protein